MKISKTIIQEMVKSELLKQEKKVSSKSLEDYTNYLIDTLLITASEYIEEDVKEDGSLLINKKEITK